MLSAFCLNWTEMAFWALLTSDAMTGCYELNRFIAWRKLFNHPLKKEATHRNQWLIHCNVRSCCGFNWGQQWVLLKLRKIVSLISDSVLFAKQLHSRMNSFLLNHLKTIHFAFCFWHDFSNGVWVPDDLSTLWLKNAEMEGPTPNVPGQM